MENTLSQQIRARLEIDLKRTRRRQWIVGAIVVAIVLFFLFTSYTGFRQDFGAFAGLVGVIMGFWLMRIGDEARDLDADLLGAIVWTEAPADDAKDDGKPAPLSNVRDRQAALGERIRRLRQRVRSAEISGVIIAAFAATFIVSSGMHIANFVERFSKSPTANAVMSDDHMSLLVLLMLAFVLTGWAFSRFASGRSARDEIERLEIESDLAPVELTQDAARARKLLLINQGSLNRYYLANRFNSRFSIAVAGLCVIAGIAITVWTINGVLGTQDEERANLVVAAVGAANAIMINVVAAIVLRIQGTIASNVNAFHERLVNSHDILLANVIAAEIDDDAVRRDTLSAIAKSIGLRSASSSKKGGGDKDKKDDKGKEEEEKDEKK